MEEQTDTEQAICHTTGDGNLHEILFGSTMKFINGINHDRPDVDLLLKRMDHEIFEDFRENLGSNLMKDLSIAII